MNFLQRVFTKFRSPSDLVPVVSKADGIEAAIFPRGLPIPERTEVKSRRAIGRRRNYNAGVVDRLTADFVPSNLSFNTNVRPSLRMMRARARHLSRNEPYTKAFLSSFVRNVVGHDGLRFTNLATNPDGSLDDAANKKIKMGFLKWGNRKTCTVTKRKSWVGIQKVICRMLGRDGEVFVRKVRGFDNVFGFAIQVIPCDYVDELYEVERLANGNRVVMGIEINPWGEPVAYYVLKCHPGDFSSHAMIQGEMRERIDAKEMCHLFISEDAEQVRGIPPVYAVITLLNQMGAWEEAEVIAARLQSCKMGFISRDPEDPYDGDDEDEDGNTIVDAEPGQIEDIGRKKFTPWDPTHPNGQYAAFKKAMLRGICAGLGDNYNLLAQDLEGVNFSSIRAGTLEVREEFKMIQQVFIEEMAEDIFETWLEVVLLTDWLKPLPYSKFDKFNAPFFRGRRWPWVDPIADMQAAAYAVLMGWKTNTQVIEDMDGDPDEIWSKLEEEKKKMEAAGIVQAIPQVLAFVNPEDDPKNAEPGTEPGKKPAPRKQ